MMPVDRETGEIEEGQPLKRELAVILISPYYNLGREINRQEKQRSAWGKPIREFLEANRGEPLEDRELGLVARLQERQGPDTYDVPAMPDALVIWAAKQGLLNMDAKPAKALLGKFAEGLELERFRMPGRPSVALVVEKRER